MAKYLPSIGIETHVQLKTTTKLFCRCFNDPKVEKPNINICPICLGMPGALPYLNKRAVQLALQVGLALNGQIASTTKFDRKHYFYPDLPKGYQISQYDQPIVGAGYLDVPLAKGSFRVGIIRAHLEEDAGKSTHPVGKAYTLVDLNRTGTPLMEIVSAPDINSPAQAKAFVQELYLTMLHAGVSDVDLYRGNMRFDVNVSLAPKGAKKLGLRTEIKNLNSFRSVEKAIAYEIKRQTELLDKGQDSVQSTRGWDEAKGKTYALRSKEGEADYRYFPEPDLPPLKITSQMVSEAKHSLPDLPAVIRQRLGQLKLSPVQIAAQLISPRQCRVVLNIASTNKAAARSTALLFTNTAKKIETEAGHKPNAQEVPVGYFIKLYELKQAGLVSSNTEQTIFLQMLNTGQNPEQIAKEHGLIQTSDTAAIEAMVKDVLKANAAAVKDYQAGNERSLQFLVGQVMRVSKGQANPQLASELVKKQLAG